MEIDYEEAGEFMTRYLGKLDALGMEHLLGYEIPQKEIRVLLWTAE